MSHINCRKYFLSFVLLCFCAAIVDTSNILVVSPVPSISHFKIGEAIANGLADARHHVTIISAYDYKAQNISNVESIQLVVEIETAEDGRNKFKAEDLDSYEKMSVPTLVSMLLYRGANLSNITLSNSNVTKALSTRNYDLVIVEFFGTESFVGLGEMFDCPVIGFSSFSMSRWTNDLEGNASPLSYSHPLLNFPDTMKFFHRMHNTLCYMYESMVLAYLHHPLQRSVYNYAFPNAKLSYDEARKNVALTFVNSHFSLARPMPYVPNMIEIGGIHVDRKSSPLPQNIKQFIDTASDGVVYFSFGSILKGEQLSLDKRNAFINIFAKFKQRFVWKFEDSSIDMPKNVLAKSWLPQADILGHPNVKAFISHGGLLGSLEAVYHGVPFVGVPFFGDQRLNVKRASQSGWALTLDYNNISAASVEWALNEILKDKYLEAARTVSKRFHDQPMTPTETMVYWSEYVIRHGGAPHLRSTGLDLNIIQYHNVDVLLTILCSVVLTIYALIWTLQKVCCRQSRAIVKVESKEQ